jgi:hypothetical protein
LWFGFGLGLGREFGLLFKVLYRLLRFLLSRGGFILCVCARRRIALLNIVRWKPARHVSSPFFGQAPTGIVLFLNVYIV